MSCVWRRVRREVSGVVVLSGKGVFSQNWSKLVKRLCGKACQVERRVHTCAGISATPLHTEAEARKPAACRAGNRVGGVAARPTCSGWGRYAKGSCWGFRQKETKGTKTTERRRQVFAATFA